MARTVPTHVGASNLSFTARTSMEWTKATLEAAGAKAGDFLLILPYLDVQEKTLACAQANGEIGTQGDVAGFRYAAFYAKAWDGTSAIKVTWTGGASTSCTAVLEIFRGHDPTTQPDVGGTWSNQSATFSPVAPSVNTATEHALQVCTLANGFGNTIKTTPAGFTLGQNIDPSVIYKDKTTAGSTGTTTIELTAGSTPTSRVITFAIRGVETKEEEKTTEADLGEYDLAKLATPLTRKEHKLKVNALQKTGAKSIDLYVELKEGTTVIVPKAKIGTLTTSMKTYELALSEAQAEAIKNYGYPLSVHLWAVSTAEGEVELAEVWLEVPESEEEPPGEEKEPIVKSLGIPPVETDSARPLPTVKKPIKKTLVIAKESSTARALVIKGKEVPPEEEEKPEGVQIVRAYAERLTGDTGERMLEGLPPYEADDSFVQALMQAAGNEFERLETFMHGVAWQLRPQNADDQYGILGLYERLIGLPVESDAGIEARRSRVLAAIGRGRKEGIGEGWADLITLLLDSGGWVEVENTPGQYEITITVPFESTSFRAGGLESLLSQITPAHIRVHIIYTDSFLVGDLVGDQL